MKKYILIVATLFTAGISGCKKDYLSQEVNPNAPSVTTPQLSLAGALATSANIVTYDYEGQGVWAGYFTTSGNYVPNTTLNQFNLTTGSLNGDWGDWYGNLTNYNLLQNLAAKDPSLANFQAIAIIMKAYGFQHLVDEFNDVPYSQAFQPATILFPGYDKGSAIYEDLGKQLDNAITIIKGASGAVNPGTSDIVFGGNMAGWEKFANSLKLRLAMRVSTKSASDPLIADLASTESVGYLDGTLDAELNPGYSNTSGKQNPFYSSFGVDATGNPGGNEVYYRAPAYEITTMIGYNDPRAASMYAPVSSDWPNVVIRGNTFGDPLAKANPLTSSIGPGLAQSSSQNSILFSGAESLFLQAEAVEIGALPAGSAGLSTGYTGNGATGGSAQALYEGGIVASFIASQAGGTYAPVPADGSGNPITAGQTPTTPNFVWTAPSAATSTALAQTYLAQTVANVGWTTSATTKTGALAAIYTQKWFALTGLFPFEAWNEQRRTGLPAIPTSVDPARVNPIPPYRVLYPQSELSTNATNLGKEGTINPFSSKIFWQQ